MSDKSAIKQLQDRVKKAVSWQARVKELAVPPSEKPEQAESDERT